MHLLQHHLSYICVPNMHNVTSAHNKAVLSKQPQLNNTINSKSKERNCRQKDSCPLSGKCLTYSVVYQAIVTRDDTTEEKTFVGHTEGRASSKRDITTILIHLETLNINMLPRSVNVNYSIKWKTIKKCRSYSNKLSDATYGYMKNVLLYIIQNSAQWSLETSYHSFI